MRTIQISGKISILAKIVHARVHARARVQVLALHAHVFGQDLVWQVWSSCSVRAQAQLGIRLSSSSGAARAHAQVELKLNSSSGSARAQSQQDVTCFLRIEKTLHIFSRPKSFQRFFFRYFHFEKKRYAFFQISLRFFKKI